MVAPQHTEGTAAAEASVGPHFETTSQSLAEKTSPQDITDIQSSVDTGAGVVDEYPHGIRLILLAGASIMGVFLISLDQTIVGTAIPKITAEFDGLKDVSWYSAAYFMTFGGLEASWGKAFKYFDIKWTFIASLTIFEIGSLICGVAPSSVALIIGRAIAGIGAAGISVGGTSIVAFSVPPKTRPILMGIIGLMYGLSSVLGPLIGGAFTENATWRWCFYINLPVGALGTAIVVIFFHLPAAVKRRQSVSARRCFTWIPSGSQVIGLLVGFGVLTVALILWSMWLGEYAMMIPRLFKKRGLWSVCPYQFFFLGDLLLLLYYLPIYFQSVKGASPIQSGVDNLPIVIAVAIFAVLGGVFVTTTGLPAPAMFVGALLGTVGCGLFYTLEIDTPSAKWISYQILTGSAIAFSVQNGLNIAQASVDPEDLPAITACLYFFQTVGGAFTVSSGQAAFVNQMLAKLASSAPGVAGQKVINAGASDLRNVFSPEDLSGVLVAYMHGLKATFALSIAFCAIALVATLFVPWKRLATHAPEDKEEGEQG
ncbi:MDR family MFS transporter [Aspergillus melleus]|uniref:MDR family MFS transporter n=1 Tax=Aspergillus melleus TaxID=138277 RepID=UPI001E8D0E9C|nr:uncharacterized protein LDX57_011899 [Aspergillus melleus]KAH8434261.1 hypothetical protein LDX57_011899 [Aspergillus melleus]